MIGTATAIKPAMAKAGVTKVTTRLRPKAEALATGRGGSSDLAPFDLGISSA